MIGEHRYELKFLVSAQTKSALLKHAQEGLTPDVHGEDGVYRVSSLYFDSPGREAYWEKLDGVRNRAKYRLRYYGDEPLGQAAFMEIKHRFDQTVYKERVPLVKGALETVFQDPEAIGALHAYTAELKPPQELTLERILRAANEKPLVPVNLISYKRQAWVGRYDDRLRVTFDHLCRAFPTEEPCRPVVAPGTPLLAENQMVLEVKFNSRLPVWMRDALSQVAVQPIRFSKYVEGLMALEDLPVRRLLARRDVVLQRPFTLSGAREKQNPEGEPSAT